MPAPSLKQKREDDEAAGGWDFLMIADDKDSCAFPTPGDALAVAEPSGDAADFLEEGDEQAKGCLLAFWCQPID